MSEKKIGFFEFAAGRIVKNGQACSHRVTGYGHACLWLRNGRLFLEGKLSGDSLAPRGFRVGGRVESPAQILGLKDWCEKWNYKWEAPEWVFRENNVYRP